MYYTKKKELPFTVTMIWDFFEAALHITRQAMYIQGTIRRV
jgi:hypothetical protein